MTHAPVLARLPPHQQEAVLRMTAASMSAKAAAVPPWVAYPHQVPPESDWDVWALIAGRGAGKTEAGARYVDSHAKGPACIPGKVPHRIAIVAPSHDDAVDTCVRGDSGIARINPFVRFHPGAALQADLTWSNGSEAELYGAFAPEDVERFRGPQHCLVWGDEFAAWRKLDDAVDMIEFGLRLGPHPRWVITTTPKRRKVLKDILARPTTVVSRASTADNPALPQSRRDQLYARYGGTTLGRQELNAEMLDDVQGALWRREMIEALRVPAKPDMTRIVVAIDPSATSTESADECGIIAAGVNWQGHGFVLADRSLRASPNRWASEAIALYHDLKADRIIAETNNGGEMVGQVIRSIDAGVAYKAVTASRGKQTRAEPIASFYEQGKIHHVGTLEQLEDQMCQWVPGEKSPDRMDALVWAMTELMIDDDNPWTALVGQQAGGVA